MSTICSAAVNSNVVQMTTIDQQRQIVLRADVTRDQSLAVWYGPDPDVEKGSPPDDIVAQAYSQALRFHRDEFAPTPADAVPWLSTTTSVHHVLEILAKTQQRYTDKKRTRWKITSASVSWWKLLSSRIMQYDRVIDALVSSHPEYTALVWGAMRFLFTVTINHEELSSKIAQAFAEIAEVLPEAEFISQSLYPTQRIQLTLANAYAQIVEFCIRATKWYDRQRRNPVKKVLSAVVKSWPLEFQDIKSKIDALFRRLREQSAVAHQAETRQMHIQIGEIRQFLDQACSLSQAFGEHRFSPLSRLFANTTRLGCYCAARQPIR